MIDRRNKISSIQLMIFIIGAQIGIGILDLPYRLAKNVGHDGWISVLLTGFLTGAASLIILRLLDRYKDKSIYEINRYLYGKYIGVLFNIIILLYLILAVSLGSRLLVEMVKMTVLKLTPPLVLSSFIIIPTVYLVWSGLKPVCRFASLILIMIVLIFLLFLLIGKFIRLTFIMPVGEAGINKIMGGIFTSFFAFLGFELIAVVYPNVTDKQNASKHITIGSIITTLFYTLFTLLTTGFFGENMLKHLIFPLYSLTRSYRAPVLERIDLYFIALWVPAMAISLRAYFYSTYDSINKMFNIKRKTLSILIFTIAAILIGRIPKDLVELYEYLNILSLSGIGVAVFIIMSYIVSLINKRGVQR